MPLVCDDGDYTPPCMSLGNAGIAFAPAGLAAAGGGLVAVAGAGLTAAAAGLVAAAGAGLTAAVAGLGTGSLQISTRRKPPRRRRNQ